MLACVTLLGLLLTAAPLDSRLVLRIPFDECAGAVCRDASGHGLDASPQRRPEALRRVPGLFGNALALSDGHLLGIPNQPDLNGATAVTFSAWVRPTELSGYREIFRKEDGDQRLLFSFQNDGTILSLGLNLGGYVECDAPVDSQAVLDGQWHFCAATFDGRTMRVFLDGVELGHLDRPGTIQAGGAAPGCIGSSSGGECFVGALDELRIYRAALTTEELGQLYDQGSQAMQQQELPDDAPRLQVAPLAWWPGDEPVPTAEIAAQVGPAATGAGPVARGRGIHARALELHGEHALATLAVAEQDLDGIAFSAWVKPTELSGYREIFRQECARRLLFSFQGSGTILSLGLNIGGYEECDASIRPEQVLDGAWHHCAGTFDGQTMRVYLDGREIGSLERPGKVSIDPDAACYLGSSSGDGEWFQGGLDDLRVYGVRLSAEQVTALWEAGRAAQARRVAALQAKLEAALALQPTFAETMAASRAKLLAGGLALDLDVAELLRSRLRQQFPEESAQFRAYTGREELEYLVAPDDTFQRDQARRLVALALEYRPLTAAQQQRESAADRARWAELAQLPQRLEQLASGGETASPDWLTFLFDCGRQVCFRPTVREAVAPYIPPETPQTRTLAAPEARELLERDWLHQCGGRPTPEAIRQELVWARELAARLASEHPIDLLQPLAALEKLEAEAESLTEPDRELYFKVREVKRRILFSNPVLDFGQVLFVDTPYPAGSEWRHETRHRLGYMAQPGGRLLVLDGLSPAGTLRQLLPQAPLHGSFWRPDLSFDGKTALVSFKPHNEKSFHLYEIGLDGSGYRQLTSGPYDDLDPIYLPDGHLLFSTTRAHSYVRCMPPTNAFPLARCDRDGRNIYLLSTNNEPDYLPSLLPDGRVLYTRWEYTDKPLWRAQGLWAMHPDGTQVNVFWGNQSVWPDLLKDARAIPGSRRVMFTGSAHHNWFAGAIGILDPDDGLNFPAGLTKVTADMPWPECGNGPVDPVESSKYHAAGSYSGYYSPYPLSDHDFLVSACRSGKFVLYLMDTDGNRELIYEGTHQILHAQPVRTRPSPPALTDAVDWPTREHKDDPADGILYSGNVYEGAPAVLRGKARYLRVLSIDAKTYTYWDHRPYASTGPVVSMVQSDGVKRVLGTVPIEADGSVCFKAPSGISLHFQLLDERHRALQTMRSFASLMPGEIRGCTGCHEAHSRAPAYAGRPLALDRPPQTITPPPWGSDTVSYDRYVQPALDRYCGKCHQGDAPGRQTLDLTRRPGYAMFDEPYVTLTGRPTWGSKYVTPQNPPPGFGIADTILVEGYDKTSPEAYVTPAPMTRLSYRSRLIELASSGQHHGVKLDDESLLRLILWIDTMCPYYGDDEIRQLPDPEFQGVDWLAVRPLIRSAPNLRRPGPVD